MSAALIGDALTVAGLVVVTISVVGVWRLEDAHLQLHAAGKAAVLGVAALLLGASPAAGLEGIGRALLVIALLMVTAPVAAHAVAGAAREEGEREDADSGSRRA